MLRSHFLNLKTNNPTGIVREVLFAPEEWFTTIASPPAIETVPGDDIIITTDHVFIDADHGFIKLQFTDRTAEFNMDQVGETGSESLDCKLKGFYSGVSNALMSFMGKPFDGIVLVQDNNCAVGTYWQLGMSCNLAMKKGWKFGTSKKGEGKKGFDIGFESNQSQGLVYAGAIVLATEIV